MVSDNLRPHVPPEADPGTLLPLLQLLLEQGQSFPTVKSLRMFSSENGLSDRQEIPIFATSVGLLEQTSEGFTRLSADAVRLLNLEKKVHVDLVHFLSYTGWVTDAPRKKGDLWGYRQVSDIFWERAPVNVLFITDFITEEVRNRAFNRYGEDVSFSPKSIRGVRKWLEALVPPVIRDDVFNRRHFCQPELLLLAAGWVARQSDAEVGIDMLLTPERREAICRLCLLEPSVLDQVLDWMLPLFPQVVEPGTTAGIYGRFLRFRKWPELADLE